MHKKPRVLFELYSIAHYHVPFLKMLGEQTELVVVASKNKEVDGLKDIKENLPFKTLRLPETPQDELFHQDIMKIIEEYQPEIYISISSIFDRMLWQKKYFAKLKNLGIKTIWMGCDGYATQNFRFHLLKNMMNPKSMLRTIKEIVAKSRVDFFLPQSSHTFHYLNQSLFVPTSKMRIVCNAIDTSEINNLYKQSNKSDLPFLKKDKIISVGRLTKRKAADKLILAFHKVISKGAGKHPNLSLQIIGEGSEMDNLKKLIEKLGLGQKVEMVGGVYDDKQLFQYFSKSVLYVMPGIGGLGFNTAMAAGMPIIYTHADGTEEDLFENGVNGIFFDGSIDQMAEKIEYAIEHPDEMKRMGERSEKLITEKFNLENMLNGYMSTIKTLVKKDA